MAQSSRQQMSPAQLQHNLGDLETPYSIIDDDHVHDDQQLLNIRIWLDRQTTLKPYHEVLKTAVKAPKIAFVEYVAQRYGKKVLHEQDEAGQSALFYAAASRRIAAIEYILSTISELKILRQTDKKNNTPIIHAIINGNPRVVALLLAKDPKLLDETRPRLKTAINEMLAVYRIDSREIEYMLWTLFDYYELIKPESKWTQPLYVTLTGPGMARGRYSMTKPITDVLCDSLLHPRDPSIRPPGPKTDYKTWVHIPSTNAALFGEVGRSILNWGDYIELSGTFPSPPIDPGDPVLRYREPGLDTLTVKMLRASVVFPFFAFETLKKYKVRRESHEKLRLLSPSGGQTAYFERTLHETYYPGLSPDVLVKENQNQLATGEDLRRVESEDEEDIPIDKRLPKHESELKVLLVPQIWLWQYENTLISACSVNEDLMRPMLHQEATAASSEFERNEVEWMQKYLPNPPARALALLLAAKIKAFGNRQEEKFPPVLQVYQEAVFALVTDTSAYFDPSTSMDLSIKKESDFLRRINKIKTELAMIKEILTQQEKIIDDLFVSGLHNFEKYKPEDNSVDAIRLDDTPEIREAKDQLPRYREQAEKIERDAERIAQSIQDQLDLKRTHASIKDTRSSLLLGVAVAGFTIVTIVFTPLAFLCSYFALNIDSLDKHKKKPNGEDSDDAAYTSSYIKEKFVTVELVSLFGTALVVIVSLWFGGAFTIRGASMSVWKYSKKRFKKAQTQLRSLEQEAQKPVDNKKGPEKLPEEKEGAKKLADEEQGLERLGDERKGPGMLAEEVKEPRKSADDATKPKKG